MRGEAEGREGLEERKVGGAVRGVKGRGESQGRPGEEKGVVVEEEEEEDEGPRLLIYSSKSRVQQPREFVKLEILIKTVNHTFLFVQRQSAKKNACR